MSTTSKTPQTRLQGRRMASRPMSQMEETPKKFVFVIVSISFIIVTSITIGFFKYHKSIIHLPKMNSITDQLIYTLQIQAFNLIPLFICVAHVILTRIYTGVINPLSGQEILVEKPVRILTNTLEQSFLHIFCQLVLATYLPAKFMFVMPFLVFCFVVGRILFLVGYTIHPKYRSIGFIMSYGPMVAAFVTNLIYATGLNRIIHSSVPKTDL